jgi:translation initiation factor IF-3
LKNKINWRVNHQIKASKVRLIGKDGKQAGIVTKDKALQEARKAGLDLVEIAPNAEPPVVKIVELGKFKYEQEKKARKSKKKSKAAEVKEVRLSPFIGDHDFKTRLEKIQEFFDGGNKIKIVVKFKGRQMGSKEFGYKIIKRVLNEIKGNISIDMEPKFIGRHLSMIISPTNKAVSDSDKIEKIFKKYA